MELDLISLPRAARLYGVRPQTLERRARRDPSFPPICMIERRRYLDKHAVLAHYEQTLLRRREAAGL